MATAETLRSTGWTLADLLKQFGPIPAYRIRNSPLPGTATEQDVIEIEARENQLCELVDGVLVEKIMGYYESCLASFLGRRIGNFTDKHDLGVVAGEAGMMRLAPGLIRIPDVSFVSWDRFPNREVPAEPLPDLVPDLAIEVLSEGNTREEMQSKIRDYFRTGTRLVWVVDPKPRTVRVYTSVRRSTLLREGDRLDGGDVLPGFTLPVRTIFSRARQRRR